jgi:predicted aconitase with swiveling domain
MITGITLLGGTASGRPIVLSEPLSFWGGYDSTDGRIIDRWHPQTGTVLAGRVLVVERGRGSSSGSSVLAEAIRAGTAPSAILMRARDAIIVIGAMVAAELYAVHCPIVLIENDAAWQAVSSATELEVDASGAAAKIHVTT